MVVQVRAQSGTGEDEQENNQQSYSFDTHIQSTTGRHRIYLHILSASDNPKVRLYLYGLASNMAVADHTHSTHTHTAKINSTGSAVALEIVTGGGATFESGLIASTTVGSGQTLLTNTTDIPIGVQILINGTNKTPDIGDQNSQGAVHYNSASNLWGVSAEWSSGELDLSSIITWSVQTHYIELLCNGTGGRILGTVLVN